MRMKQTAKIPSAQLPDLSGLENAYSELQAFLKQVLALPKESVDPERKLKIVDLLEDINDLAIGIRMDILYPEHLTKQAER